MKKKSIFLVTFALFFTLLVSLERVYYWQNRGFRLAKLISTQSSIAALPPLDVDAMLDQPFHYFGGGGTCFAFLGEDGQTILKLFKHQQLFYKSFYFHLAFPGISDAWRIRRILSREQRHSHKRHPFFFNSCNLAYREFKEETGLIYLCLQPNSHFNRQIQLVDAWGISHHFNLSQTEFALQKKADLLFPYLQKLLEQKNMKGAKEAIDSLLSQILLRCKKGIGDRDPNMRINFGFIEGKAVEFDLGSYYSDPTLNAPFEAAREMFFATFVLQDWLEKHSPDLLDYVLESIAQIPSNVEF
jgi:hypothetical protein